MAAARPGAGRFVEAADLLEHEGDEGRRLGAAVQHRTGALAELALGPRVERGGRMSEAGVRTNDLLDHPAVIKVRSRQIGDAGKRYVLLAYRDVRRDGEE